MCGAQAKQKARKIKDKERYAKKKATEAAEPKARPSKRGCYKPKEKDAPSNAPRSPSYCPSPDYDRYCPTRGASSFRPIDLLSMACLSCAHR